MTARNLKQAFAQMTWTVEPGEFALMGLRAAPTGEDLALLANPPAQLIREVDETTLLIRVHDVAQVEARHPEARVEHPLLWVRFDAPMGWEVVGFLAHVTTALADAGIPIGAVCGFSRDHLFLNTAYRERALAVLEQLFPRRAPGTD